MSGIVFSTLAGFCWAITIIIYKKYGDSFSPVTLNLIKSILALILITPLLLYFGIEFLPDKPLKDYVLISLSGIFGIAVADSLFFAALKRVGASFMAVIDCLYLPSVLIFSFILLDERMGFYGFLGGGLVFAGIFLGSYTKSDVHIDRKDMIYGVILGCSAIFLIAVSIVGIKEILNSSNEIWVTFLRNGAGIIALLIMLPFSERVRFEKELFLSKNFKAVIIGGIFNFLALLFWIAGMKYAMVSIAAILNQLSIVFIYIFAVVFLKESATKKKTFAMVLALTGAVLAVFHDQQIDLSGLFNIF